MSGSLISSIYLNKLKELFALKSHTHPTTDITNLSNLSYMGFPDYAKSRYIPVIGSGTYDTYTAKTDTAKKSGWFGTSAKNSPVLIFYFKTETDLNNFENSSVKNNYYYRRHTCAADMGLVPEANTITADGTTINIFTMQNTYQVYYGLYKVSANGFVSMTSINIDFMVFVNHVAVYDHYTTGNGSNVNLFLPVKANDEVCIAFREDGYETGKFDSGHEVEGYPIIHSYFIPLLQ